MARTAIGAADRHVERLGEHGHLHVVDEALIVRVLRRAGDEDEAVEQIGVALLDLAKEAEPVELGHPEVAQHDVVGAPLEALQRGQAVGRGVDVVALAAEDIGDELRDDALVVDHQDPRPPAHGSHDLERAARRGPAGMACNISRIGGDRAGWRRNSSVGRAGNEHPRAQAVCRRRAATLRTTSQSRPRQMSTIVSSTLASAYHHQLSSLRPSHSWEIVSTSTWWRK